jgi:hypothetical protein
MDPCLLPFWIKIGRKPDGVAIEAKIELDNHVNHWIDGSFSVCLFTNPFSLSLVFWCCNINSVTLCLKWPRPYVRARCRSLSSQAASRGRRAQPRVDTYTIAAFGVPSSRSTPESLGHRHFWHPRAMCIRPSSQEKDVGGYRGDKQ